MLRNEDAVSINPPSTSRIAASTKRATNGAAAIVSGTIAAPEPIEVPATSRVNGMIATTRMMKGVDRVALTIMPRTALTEGAANNSPLRLVARKIPIGRPNIVASDAATETMNRLSPVASMIRLMRSRDITKALHRKLILRKPGQCLPLRGLIAGNTERQRADVLTSDLVDPGRQQSYIDAKLACEARYDGIARIRSPYLHANNGPTASYRLRVQPAYQRNRNILA